MAHKLPFELWTHVALYLEDDASSFPKYARVCRQWQPVFERLIYRSLKVSTDGAELGKGAVSLSQFQSLMSDPRQYRPSFLRRLDYTIVTPHEIEDYSAMKLESKLYTERNPVRQANNEAFSQGIRSLFEILKSWDAHLKITLAMAVHGREKTLEPETEAIQYAYQWQTVLDGQQWLPVPYHARFPDDCPDMPRVACVDELLFESNYSYQGIWSGAAMQIAEHCVALRRIYLHLEELVRPDHLDYIRERRQAVALALPKLPSTLRSFELDGNAEEPWLNILPALDLRARNDFDDFSCNMGSLSLTLKDLKLTLTSVEMDFLFPLDEDGAPTPRALSLHWPYMESLTLTALPMCLPSGEWLFDCDLSPATREMIPGPTTGFAIFDTQLVMEETEYFRDKMKIEHFHRLFISLGYAAQHMPRLKSINTSMVHTPDTQFKFISGREVGEGLLGNRPTLSFDSMSGYKPDERVADAWGFSLDDLEIEDLGVDDVFHQVYAKVALDRFPAMSLGDAG